MNQVTNDGFIVIDGQVAMPEETAAELLNVTIDELRRASRAVGIKNSQGGIYVHNGKYYYSSHGILFKVRDINGKKSADLSTRGLIKLFQSAEERLLPQEEFKAKRRKEQIQGVILIVIIGFFIHSCFSSDSEPKKISAPPPVPKFDQKGAISTVFFEASRKAIEEKTRLYVTDSWLLEYNERECQTVIFIRMALLS